MVGDFLVGYGRGGEGEFEEDCGGVGVDRGAEDGEVRMEIGHGNGATVGIQAEDIRCEYSRAEIIRYSEKKVLMYES